MEQKIALTIPTGRPNVKNVVRAFLENAEKHGYNLKNFSIYLSIDREYNKTKKEDFILDKELEKKVSKIRYILEEDRENLGKEIYSETLSDYETIEKLFIGRGYSKQRNSAMIFALRDKNDFAICIDDDEAPFIPIRKKAGYLKWEEPDFFGPHIKELSSGTDITRGPYMGYLSPIPSDFEKDIPSDIRKALGEALQWGSDVVTSQTFFNLMNQIRYLKEEEFEGEKRPFVVESGEHGKHIYAGNMGINLHSLEKGKIPIFYTPPNARGEDTIFALQLEDLEVKEVNSFIFHDPFNLYPKIFEKEFPEELKKIPVSESSKNRFASALIGWLKYAPILIHLTAKDENEKEYRLKEMMKKIGEPTQKLAEMLECPEMNECEIVLNSYSKDVLKHINELNEAQKLWKKSIPKILKETK